MNLGLLEDRDLYQLAAEIVTEDGSGVDNAQISGLLATIRASGSYNMLRRMAEHQLEKARKEGDRSAGKAAFFDRLLKGLRQVDRHADDFVSESLSPVEGKPSRKEKETRRKEKARWSGRLASTLITHIAAEHRWQGSRR